MHPDLEQRMKNKDLKSTSNLFKQKNQTNYIIPIVFHILHLGGPENISDSQVKDALRILNRDYARQNPDTVEIIPSFKSLADSTGIRFVLATKDTNGNCTNGIIHYYDPNTDWVDSTINLYSHTWDPRRYLNVYVVRTITLSNGFGAAGYTFFPGSLPTGFGGDAIVVLNNYFGSIGTGSVFQSRVLTHEVGHWFNLYHVFGLNGAGVNCGGDDKVDDTPTTKGFLYCPNAKDTASYQVCNPGVDENFQNYMDYSYCCKMFTPLQAQRMRDALEDTTAGRNNLWSASNLASTGVLNPSTVCIPVADFVTDRSITCVGAPVTFTDASWNGQPVSYNWSFPSGSPSTSTSSNPVVTYNTPGTYGATLIVTNTAGSSVPETKTGIITVVNNIAAYKNTWSDGFETSALPNADWKLKNSSGGANWMQSADAAYSGAFSAKLPYPNNTRRAVTVMTGPALDLSTFPNPVLNFKLAALEIDPNHINNLKVLISVDCQENWTEIYSKTGMALVANPDSISVPFVPVYENQWRTESINLSSFATSTAANFKFVYTRDTVPGAMNVYIDDINISDLTSVVEATNYSDVKLFPNPSPGRVLISFNSNENSRCLLKVQDLMGRIISEQQERFVDAGDHSFSIGEQNPLQEGVYIISLRINDQGISKKLVVTR